MSCVKFYIVFIGHMDSNKILLERFKRKIKFEKSNNTSKFLNFIIFSKRFSWKSVSFQCYHPKIIFLWHKQLTYIIWNNTLHFQGIDAANQLMCITSIWLPDRHSVRLQLLEVPFIRFRVLYVVHC